MRRFAFDARRGEMFEIAKGAYVEYDDAMELLEVLEAKVAQDKVTMRQLRSSNKLLVATLEGCKEELEGALGPPSAQNEDEAYLLAGVSAAIDKARGEP